MIRAALKALLMMILVGWGASALLFSVVDYSGAFGFLAIPEALALTGGDGSFVLVTSTDRKGEVVSCEIQVAPEAGVEAPMGVANGLGYRVVGQRNWPE